MEDKLKLSILYKFKSKKIIYYIWYKLLFKKYIIYHIIKYKTSINILKELTFYNLIYKKSLII